MSLSVDVNGVHLLGESVCPPAWWKYCVHLLGESMCVHLLGESVCAPAWWKCVSTCLVKVLCPPAWWKYCVHLLGESIVYTCFGEWIGEFISSVSLQDIGCKNQPFNYKPPSSAGSQCAELLKSMLCVDPTKRISMKVCDNGAASALDILFELPIVQPRLQKFTVVDWVVLGQMRWLVMVITQVSAWTELFYLEGDPRASMDKQEDTWSEETFPWLRKHGCKTSQTSLYI